ncbi:hypothetical protein A2U01_0075490, partial [Trifolium medium]|nr:hypothetical protein [Trifolium medium]
DFLLEPGAESPVPVVDGVGLFAVAVHASFPCDASQLAPAVLDIVDASLVVDVASASTDLLSVQSPVLLLYTSLALQTFFELQTLYSNCHNQIELA